MYLLSDTWQIILWYIMLKTSEYKSVARYSATADLLRRLAYIKELV